MVAKGSRGPILRSLTFKRRNV
jgi:hypothetical protein